MCIRDRLEFAVTASKGGVQPIVGSTLNLRREEAEDARRLRVVGGTSHVGQAPDQLVLIAQTDPGYRNRPAVSYTHRTLPTNVSG